MGLDVQHHVEVAGGAVVAAGFAFSGNAQPRIRIHARGNAQINRARALDAALSAALGAAFANNLSRAAAIRASARNGEKSLLVVNLPAAATGDARYDSRTGLRARSVASLAEFQSWNADFGVHAGGGFLERQLHVIAKIRAALRAAAATAPSAQNILKSEEVSENILKLVEDGLIDAAVKSAARQSGVAKTVIRGALLRIGENRICFGGLPELFLRLLLGVRVAVGMPFQRRLAVRGLDLVRAGALHYR